VGVCSGRSENSESESIESESENAKTTPSPDGTGVTAWAGMLLNWYRRQRYQNQHSTTNTAQHNTVQYRVLYRRSENTFCLRASFVWWTAYILHGRGKSLRIPERHTACIRSIYIYTASSRTSLEQLGFRSPSILAIYSF